jgi:hypothetical protein
LEPEHFHRIYVFPQDSDWRAREGQFAEFERKNIMTLLMRAGAASLIAAVFALGASAATISANAAPAAASAANGSALSTNSAIVKVQGMERRNRGEWRRGRGGDWNRGRRHRGYYDYGWNPGAYIGLGIGGAVLEGALSDDYYADSPDYADGPGYGEGSSLAMQRCAAQFRSFEWDTGLYTTYEGEKRLCPYLG